MAEAKTEIKTLSTKLTAARSAEPAASVKVPGVKKEQDEEVFDCVQTGRNGSKLKSSAMRQGKGD